MFGLSALIFAFILMLLAMTLLIIGSLIDKEKNGAKHAINCYVIAIFAALIGMALLIEPAKEILL